MWPLPRFSHKQLHTILQPHRIDCYYMIKDNTMHALMAAHKRYDLNLAADKLIYNLTTFVLHVTDFINMHQLHLAYHYITVVRPLIDEKIIMHTANHAQLHELIEPLPHTHYTHSYIGTDNDYSLFYLSSIAQPLLLQLRIMHTMIDAHLQAIFTPFELQMKLYHYVQPQQQVASLVDCNTITIKQLDKCEPVQQYLQHHKEYNNREQLLYALGSFIGSEI